MVHKNSKHQVHSGNTLRASNSRYNRRYRRQGCIVRRMNEGAKAIHLLDELNIGENDVAYSLNKKSRWNIPLILKNEILYNKNMLDYTTRVSLIESHKLKKSSKCISYCSSKGPIKKVTPKKSKTYFNDSSVSQTTFRKESNTQENINPEIKAKEPPQITVNVFYPCPTTSAITHNPKYIRFPEIRYTTNDDEEAALQKPDGNFSTKPKSKRHRKRLALSGKSKDLLWDLEEDIDDFLDADDVEDSSDECSRVGHPSDTVSLEDILLHTQKMQDIYKRGIPMRGMEPSCRLEDKKGKVIYSTEDQSEYRPETQSRISLRDSAEEQMSATTLETNMLPVAVHLPILETQQEYLQNTFGKKYSECPCFPRKFIIDISDKVEQALLRFKALSQHTIRSIDTSAVLVFVYNVYQGLENSSHELFDIYLNNNTQQSSVLIESLKANEIYSIEEVLQRAVAFIETIPLDQFVLKSNDLKTTSASQRTKFSLLYGACQTKATVISPSQKLYFEQVMHPVISNKDSDSFMLSDLGYESFPPENCSICFESMVNKSATASQACGHWFCDTCWKDHIANAMLSVSGHVTCPEYKCSMEIPLQCLLNKTSIKAAIKLVQICDNNAVDLSKEAKWCPNEKCGMVIKTENNPKHMNISCRCGMAICFDCMQPAHWPVPCDRSKSYFTALKESGDYYKWPEDDLKPLIETVEGKPCPKCNQFIEKQGGCFSIVCACKCRFCWGCGKPYNEGHINTKDCRQEEVGDFHKIIKKTVLSEMEKQKLMKKNIETQSKMYKAAVKNRISRHPSRVKALYSKSSSITQKLKKNFWRQGNQLGRELANFRDNSTLKEASIYEKFGPFLKQMVEIYSELCHIAEFTRIYSEDLSVLSQTKFSRCELADLLRKIEGLADSISDILHRGSNNDVNIVISQLWNLRFHSEKSITALARGLRAHKH